MILRRENKIVAVVGTDRRKRTELLLDAVIAAGLAKIRTDAAKIVRRSAGDIDLDGDFAILVASFNFAESEYISQRLVRLAMSGVPVFLGTARIPNGYLQFCKVIDGE